MKKILVVAATPIELDRVVSKIQKISDLQDFGLETLVAGVGTVSTTYHLTRYLSDHKPDFILNVGIAGAFHQEVSLGAVFQVTKDCFADLGAEDKDGTFISLQNMILEGAVEFCDSKGFLGSTAHFGDFDRLPAAVGATVNTVHGFAPSIEHFRQRLACDVETMEGAAVLYTSLQFDVPMIQVRAISNHVTSRNRSAWNIPLALENLASICTYVVANRSQIRMNRALE